MVPRTKLAWFTTYVAGVALVLVVLRWLLRLAMGAEAVPSLDGWVRFASTVVVLLLCLLALRWFRNKLLWRVRNRLIVTYLFIGGVPITLVVAMALIAGYLFTEHFSMYVAASDIQAQLHQLEDANLATAREIAKHEILPEQAKGPDPLAPGRHLDVLTDASRPKWLKGNFSGIVTDHNRFYLRVARNIQYDKETLTVVSSLPVDEKLMARLARRFGAMTFNLAGRNQDSPVFEIGDQQQVSVPALPRISAGSVTAPVGKLDIEFPFGGLIQTTDWASGRAGEDEKVLLGGRTRISAIYTILSGSLGDWTGTVGAFFL
ncbi:MAG TPA: hypothetical protein VEW69_11390, partial [Alphaproteobacteria bacterium]|nr:hypothetical protein [Alphaproteobacteria bacterium]